MKYVFALMVIVASFTLLQIIPLPLKEVVIAAWVVIGIDKIVGMVKDKEGEV